MLQIWITALLSIGRPEIEMLVTGVLLEAVRQAAPYAVTD
jgi:hypothetical protein